MNLPQWRAGPIDLGGRGHKDHRRNDGMIRSAIIPFRRLTSGPTTISWRLPLLLPRLATYGLQSRKPRRWSDSGHTTPRKTGRRRKSTSDILAGQTACAQVARKRDALYGSEGRARRVPDGVVGRGKPLTGLVDSAVAVRNCQGVPDSDQL